MTGEEVHSRIIELMEIQAKEGLTLNEKVELKNLFAIAKEDLEEEIIFERKIG